MAGSKLPSSRAAAEASGSNMGSTVIQVAEPVVADKDKTVAIVDFGNTVSGSVGAMGAGVEVVEDTGSPVVAEDVNSIPPNRRLPATRPFLATCQIPRVSTISRRSTRWRMRSRPVPARHFG